MTEALCRDAEDDFVELKGLPQRQLRSVAGQGRLASDLWRTMDAPETRQQLMAGSALMFAAIEMKRLLARKGRFRAQFERTQAAFEGVTDGAGHTFEQLTYLFKGLLHKVRWCLPGVAAWGRLQTASSGGCSTDALSQQAAVGDLAGGEGLTAQP